VLTTLKRKVGEAKKWTVAAMAPAAAGIGMPTK
jgi:hypothetical protein